MHKLLEFDRELFLFFNDLHSSWLDQPMYFLSNTIAWLPLHILLLYLIFKDHKKQSWVILIAIVILITLCDQIPSSLMKPYFERLRPSRDPALEGMVHVVNDYRGGLYGFASSHAANTFGMATFLFLLMRKRRPAIIFVFLWAAFVSYTRIYLGVHYPGDILAGAIIGIICAMLIYPLTISVLNRLYNAPSGTADN
jgi:undecaprenyl-diphosphatase